MEAQRQTREGYRQRNSQESSRMYPLPSFGQGHKSCLICFKNDPLYKPLKRLDAEASRRFKRPVRWVFFCLTL